MTTIKPNSRLASIVIVTYNSISTIEACLSSVFEHTHGIDFEIIIVDNASTDGTPEFLGMVSSARITLNTTNRGFAAANNQGIAEATGNVIVLLNPDTVVTSGWLTRMVHHLNSDPGMGAVGPLCNRASEIQIDTFAYGAYANASEMHRYAASVTTRNYGKVVQFHRLSGFCIALRAEVLEKIGGFDEDFGIGYYEDDDLSRRILEAGYHLGVAQDVFIHHEGGVSFSQTVSGTTSKQMLINRQLYLSKWARASWYKDWPNSDVAANSKVSVVMATRDRPQIIKHAIASVLAQSFANFELIIVNDGETDLTGVIDSFEDGRIRLLSSNKSGKPAALNRGVEVAKGDFVAYLDDDDFYYPWHLETMLKALTNRPAYMLAYADSVEGHCTIEEGDHHLRSLAPRMWEVDYGPLLQGNYIPNLSVVHRHELLALTGAFDASLPMYEDWDMLRRWTAFTDFLHVPLITSEWHHHVNMERRNRPGLEVQPSSTIQERTSAYIRSKPPPVRGALSMRDHLANAESMKREGRLETAAGEYLSVLQSDALSWQANTGAARVLKALRRPGQIQSLLQTAVRSRPDIAQTHLDLADWIIAQPPQTSNIRLAKQSLELALIADAGAQTSHVYEKLALCYRRLHLKESARACGRYAELLRPAGRAKRLLTAFRSGGLAAVAYHVLHGCLYYLGQALRLSRP